jgi:hypothetical protein
MVKERRNSLSTQVNLGLAGFSTKRQIGGKSTFGLGAACSLPLVEFGMRMAGM